MVFREGMILPFDTRVAGKKIHYGRGWERGYDVVLACNDTLKFAEQIPSRTVSLIVSSPHYNVGKSYEKKVKFKEYLEWQRVLLKRCVEILGPEGSICWEIGNYVEKGEVFPLDIFFYDIFKSFGLKLRNRIIWHYEHGLHSSRKFSGRYETILWFTKGDSYVFNLDAVRVPQKYPGKRAYKGRNKGKPSGNPLGKNPSDVWKVILEDWNKGIWEIPNVKYNHPEKTIHPAQFPIELAERLVLALTHEDDVVFDPFVGVGSSMVAAVLHNRKAIGVDKEKTYIDIAHQRTCEALLGSLRKRPLGKPIYSPRGTEKVATIPLEWRSNC